MSNTDMILLPLTVQCTAAMFKKFYPLYTTDLYIFTAYAVKEIEKNYSFFHVNLR